MMSSSSTGRNGGMDGGVVETVWERIEQSSLNKKGGLTPMTWHFMVFLVASHVTSPKGQLPDEDRWNRSQRCKLQ